MTDRYPQWTPNEGESVQWSGSELAAPGPGKRYPLKLGGFSWILLGEIERISPTDPESIKVRWENGRVTIERRRNLSPVPVLAAS